MKNKEEIMKIIKKAGNEEYETSWNAKGVPVSKKKSKVKTGRKARAQGARFELRIRDEMERRGWIIDKWTNNVDLEISKIVKAKRKYNPFKKMLVVGTGFPDFIAFRKVGEVYEVIGVEVKMNGILSKVEKEKCRWLLKNDIFSEILVVKKGEKRGAIEYINFAEKYNKT